MNSGTYTLITDGFVNQYVNGALARSLTGVEVGQCTNGSWTTLTGTYTQQPQIIVSPKSLRSYNAATSSNNQSLNCSVKYIESLGNNKWRFQPAATLNSSASQDNVSVPAKARYGSYLNPAIPYNTTNKTYTITTNSVQSGANCTKITMIYARIIQRFCFAKVVYILRRVEKGCSFLFFRPEASGLFSDEYLPCLLIKVLT